MFFFVSFHPPRNKNKKSTEKVLLRRILEIPTNLTRETRSGDVLKGHQRQRNYYSKQKT